MQAQRTALVAEQKQTLSPRMLQSIKILALPVADLTEVIQQEIDTNPALEVVEDRTADSLDSFNEDKAELQAANTDDHEGEYSDSGYSSWDGDENSQRKFLEGSIALPETLQEHLLSQLRVLKIREEDQSLGERLIQNLDDNGFHVISPKELCNSIPEHELNEMISLIQGFDPCGTCTSGYQESLLVQASLDPTAPEEAKLILRDHLEELEKGKHAEVKRALGLREPRYSAIIDYIKTLSPFPGRLFSTEKTRYVIPDLAIRIEDNEFVIELNDELIPVLGVNPFFAELSGKKDENKDTVTFARRSVEKARFFIGSIQQRNATLLKVAKSIVVHQTRFFVEGPMAMQPLSLSDVADDIGVHETTVSRVVNGKYVQTEWGIFELRRFFTNAVPGASALAPHSKESVKEVIRKILTEGNSPEGKGSKLTDREIVDMLAQRGIVIARRTVAKYRNELALDSSYGRHNH
ncbi:MAG: RNA polymerase factor sigma-54 [Spirochaetaceae bacterium]|nr:RNA polymerase factor sigma-54 [Spirochaetaceae bacterium]